MSINERPALSPEMLLFEVAGLLSRAGIAVDTSNPGAARHYAERLLGVLVTPAPAAIAATPAGSDQTLVIPIMVGGARPRVLPHHAPQRVPLGGGRKRGAFRQAIGISRGGRTSKLHALSDASGRPRVLLLTPGTSTTC